MRAFPLLLVLMMPGLATADVYKCVSAGGQITYTNERASARGCTPLSKDLPVSTIGGGDDGRGSSGPARSSVSHEDFPRVTPTQQKSRDDTRRQILDKELGDEEQALAKARQAAPGEDARSVQNRVDLHQRNIDAIRREIGNLR